MPNVASSAKPRYHGLQVTREEYLDLEEDGYRYDMMDGVLYMSPSAFIDHNDAISKILRILGNYFFEKKTGKAIVETDIFLPDGGDVLRPDISVILKENYGILKGHIHGVPDMVVEVLSESTKDRDLTIKADRYLKNGIKEYWIANPDEKSISLWINVHNASWEKIEGETVVSRLLSEFELRKDLVFED
ncbi:MAG: Uma2 family endonuclease [Spirochaetia bacterium]|nr:Uma2 family endonuclease [Spirochaetia bacterium]